VRATWAPRGQTPVLRHHFNWARLSMAGALAYRPDGSQAALVFQIQEGSCNTGSLIGFLEDMHTHFGTQKIILIWDGLPAHRSRVMSAWIAAQRRWLTVERLPGYAPTSTPSSRSGAMSSRPSWPASARTPSARPRPRPKPA
jgi:DDE superfamily endonuclease